MHGSGLKRSPPRPGLNTKKGSVVPVVGAGVPLGLDVWSQGLVNLSPRHSFSVTVA